jgi:protein-S-isoprenylcysteine O-methyltransferase Ste14
MSSDVDVLVGTVQTFFRPLAKHRRRVTPDLMIRVVARSIEETTDSHSFRRFGVAVSAFLVEILVGVILFLLVAGLLLPLKYFASFLDASSWMRSIFRASEYAVLGADALLLLTFAISATIRLVKVAGADRISSDRRTAVDVSRARAVS